MAAGRSAVDAELVLDRDDLDVVDVQEFRRAPIGIEFLFINLKSHPSRIVVAFGRSLTEPTMH